MEELLLEEKPIESLEKKVEIGEKEIEEFLNGFELSPPEKKQVRFYLQDLIENNWSLLHLLNENIAEHHKEIIKSDFVKKLAKENFIKQVEADKANEMGAWIAFKNYFEIEESFFEDKKFNAYRQKKWLENLKHGWRFDIKEGLPRESGIWGEATEDEKKERYWRQGRFSDVGLKIDDPKVKNTAVASMLNKLFSFSTHFGAEPGENFNSALDYKEFFEITDEEFKNLILDKFRAGAIDDSAVNNYLRNKLREINLPIDDFFESAEAKELAKKVATNHFAWANIKQAKDVLGYFGLSKFDLDQKVIADEARRINLEKTSDINKMTFFDLENSLQYLSKEEQQKFFEKHKNSKRLVDIIKSGLYFWELDKNLDLLKNIGTPEEIIHKVGIKMVFDETKGTDDRGLDTVLETAEKFKLTPAEVDEALTLALLERVSHGAREFEITTFKNKYQLEKISNRELSEERTKEVALGFIRKGDLSYLNLMEKDFEANWSPKDASEKRAAVKKALLNSFTLRAYLKSFNNLRQFVDRYYPKMEKINLIADPEIKTHFEEELGKRFDYWPMSEDLVRYFNLSRERIIDNIKKEIAEGRLIRDAIDERILTKHFPEIDIEKEAENCISKNGEKIFEEAVEGRDWIILERLTQFEKTNALVEKFLEDQKKVVFDINRSVSVRDYAISALSNLSEGFFPPGYLYLAKNSVILNEIARNPAYLDRVGSIGSHVSSEILGVPGNWPKLFYMLKDLSTSELLEKTNIISDLEQYKGGILSDLPIIILFDKVASVPETEQKEFFKLLRSGLEPLKDFNEKNWSEALLNYVDAFENTRIFDRGDEEKTKIKNLFMGDYKDACLAGLRNDWLTYLEKKEIILPPKLFITTYLIDEAGGAGNLKHIESLSNFIYKVSESFDNQKTALRTKEEIKDLLVKQEARFNKEKWSADDRSEFYNLSRDVLAAAPSLYSAFGPIFENLNPKELKAFMKEIMPLYQAELIIKQKNTDEDGEFAYNPRDLVGVRQFIKEFSENLENPDALKTKVFEIEKARLIQLIQANFKERFGLLKVPTEFNKEHIRSIQNAIRYMGNISGRNENREAVLAFFLGLELDGAWEKFRQGAPIDPKEYLSAKQLEIIEPILEKKQEMSKLLLEIGGLNEKDLPRFQEILQEDVLSNMVGNIETIDVRLGNVSRNISELADPDIYSEKSEKEMLALLIAEGKKIGATLSKTFAESTGKKIQLSPDERELQSKIAKIFNISKWSGEQVKTVQDLIQPLGLIVNMIHRLEEEKVNESIEELQKRLEPTEKVIEVFNRLGESFKQESGALALSKDITFLESLIVKDNQKIAPEERIIVTEYLDSIKDKMKELERILDRVKEYFDKIKKSLHIADRPILNERLAAIEKIIYATDESGGITSRMTKDLNLIIENMRQCLGCLRKEANNDTNLAFGDYNKFFLINQTGKEEGSVSDEILFFVPVKRPDGQKEMSFVFDRVYGSKGPDVLVSNALTVFKKYNALKKEFPQARLSISVSQAALSSVGLNAELFEKRFKQEWKEKFNTDFIEDLVADIPESAFSDNYVEFSSMMGTRTAGERPFSGLVIR
ncbi:hypothetical protein A2645_00730 [Candidatus Nomurabacteria bacterium RIFCSPHIGHO2_01_FULL_39_9]|uniref:Uncharacterized protein n=1 Tax=Candidatus Nomurabacteria bacterium RIFCSPHIGHO2_01_FULL_39_9 TaxID=1801735 RepID=A0A1F6UW91_9BACT|nr:MAG: hypothetical protein A2645_00730 [Candidatus Nomurabacteria bacterium RIFCSPHIGHO2_01_FULL_39_9]